MKLLGGSFEIPMVEKYFNKLFDLSLKPGIMSKKDYCNFVRELKDIEIISDKINESAKEIGNDFGSFSLFEFIVLGEELLETLTYDSYMCPDYPATQEIMSAGHFSYYEIDQPDKEIVVSGPEECWEFLNDNYNQLEEI